MDKRGSHWDYRIAGGLPKEAYLAVKELQDALGCTPRGAISTAILAARDLLRSGQTEGLKERLEQMRHANT